MKVIDNNQMFFLALMKMPGDYKFIDISKLSIAQGFSPNSLAEIDSFTMQFTKEEILDSIKDANIVEPAYQMGTLVIQDNQKHKPLPIIDKTFLDEFNVQRFIEEKISNKNIMNNIVYKFSNIINDESVVESFKLGIKSNNVTLVLSAIFSSDYLSQRKFIVYLIEMFKKEKEKVKLQELVRDKAA